VGRSAEREDHEEDCGGKGEGDGKEGYDVGSGGGFGGKWKVRGCLRMGGKRQVELSVPEKR